MFAITSAFALAIDFNQSHWFFPKIVLVLLGLVLVLAVFKYRQFLLRGFAGQHLHSAHLKRFFALVLLLAFYFWLMGWLGDWYPNMGLGFLAASVPCLWLFSWFYVAERSTRMIVQVTANAVLSPLLAWYVLGQLLNISLP